MIERIKKLLGIGKYSKMYQLQRKTKLKELLQNIKDAMEDNWEDTWMCCTDEGSALSRYLRLESVWLGTLNQGFGERCYGVRSCNMFPVHNIVTIVYGIHMDTAFTHKRGTPGAKARAIVRKELFDYWCMELIGEKL